MSTFQKPQPTSAVQDSVVQRTIWSDRSIGSPDPAAPEPTDPPVSPLANWLSGLPRLGVDLFATGFALALTAALHHAAFAWKPVWVGIAEHLYAIPILWAAIRHEWRGGLVAGVLSVAAVAWAASESNPEIRLALLLESSVFLLLGPASGWLVANWRKSVGQMKDLESQLNDRNRILAQAGKLSAAGELAMGLAHELRHPAATIRGISDLLKDPCLQPELRVECLSILERNARASNACSPTCSISRVRAFPRSGASALIKPWTAPSPWPGIHPATAGLSGANASTPACLTSSATLSS